MKRIRAKTFNWSNGWQIVRLSDFYIYVIDRVYAASSACVQSWLLHFLASPKQTNFNPILPMLFGVCAAPQSML